MESDSGEPAFIHHDTPCAMAINVLDNPVWHALTGPHRGHAIGNGRARHYPRDMAPFSAIAEPTEAAYADLAAGFPMLQMVASDVPDGGDTVGSLLSPADTTAMMDLVAATRPGPFGSRTPLLGRYLGVWHEGRLVAMAGERLRVPGHVELSAICVHPEARGKHYAIALTRQLMRLAVEAGELPFLHVRPDNVGAIALYERLGFATRRQLVVTWRRLK